MQKERWLDLVGSIKEKFHVEEHEFYQDPLGGGIEGEYIVFISPMGRVKLDYASKPVVLDKKTLYSNRAGQETKVEYVYSPTEKSSKMSAFLWSDDEDEWVEIDAKKFG
jgi:hypothetical protein